MATWSKQKYWIGIGNNSIECTNMQAASKSIFNIVSNGKSIVESIDANYLRKYKIGAEKCANH